MPEWLTFLLADTSALQLVFWLVAIVALLVAVWKLWPVLKQLVHVVDAVAGLPAFILRTDRTLLGQDQKIAEIHHEVNYNTGGSVKDAVSRVEGTTERLEIGVRGLYDRVAELGDTDEELRQAGDDLRRDFEDTQGRPLPAGTSRRALREQRTAYIPPPPRQVPLGKDPSS